MTKVLIAVDDTDESIQAATVVRRLFGDDAEYLAINVFEHSLRSIEPGSSWPVGSSPMAWGAVWPYGSGPLEPARDDQIPELTAHDVAEREASNVAERAGLDTAEVIGEVGNPADAILDAAHEHEVDLIVVGSHQRSWFSHLFSRPVSEEVVKRADIPVLVVK